MNSLLSPYLSFNGCCEAAFKFYEQCLGGHIASIFRYKDSPMAADVPPEWGDRVMHGELKLGDRLLMGSDCMPDYYEVAKGTSLMLSIADPAEAERVFEALAEAGEITMPMAETFWALRFGTLTDQFGIPWMINCDKPM